MLSLSCKPQDTWLDSLAVLVVLAVFAVLAVLAVLVLVVLVVGAQFGPSQPDQT